jgi:phage repressor protein C with HTH and peptisase S24 domain
MPQDLDLDRAGHRLKWARRRAGYSSAGEFAQAMKMPEVTYRAYENDQNGYAKHAARFGRALNVPAEWLIGGGALPDTDPPEPPQPGEFGTPKLLSERYDIELVREVDISYAMGDGSVIEDYPEVGFVPFNRAFLRRFTRGPIESLFLATGHGDSMEPTLRREEIVMIDASQQRVAQQDQIWALAYAGAGMIKRVRRLTGGRYMILSDNPAVPPLEASEDEVYIVGRVVWASRAL